RPFAERRRAAVGDRGRLGLAIHHSEVRRAPGVRLPCAGGLSRALLPRGGVRGVPDLEGIAEGGDPMKVLSPALVWFLLLAPAGVWGQENAARRHERLVEHLKMSAA